VKCFALVAVYMFFVNNSRLEERAQELQRHRSLERELLTKLNDDGTCDIGSPTHDANPAAADATKTLLASYPGSGKRFTWTLMKALTNGEVADDWNFSEKLNTNPLTIKTSWPHKEGIWSWGNQMDQVILLVRNPRWAIPSYHNMRYELDYAADWPSSGLNMLMTYTERPAKNYWEGWRTANAMQEINYWFNFVDFWMSGGFQESKNATHSRCLHSGIDCHPKAVIDFDRLYQEHTTAEFVKIVDVLDTSANVELIATQARVCVLDAVFDKKEFHQGGRPNPELPPQYRFLLVHFDRLLNRTIELMDKYSEEPYASYPHAADLVRILGTYLYDNVAEQSLEVAVYLSEFVITEFGTENCASLPGVESSVCTFMKTKANHAVFYNGEYPDGFPFTPWLKDRTILARMFYNNCVGDCLANPPVGWMSVADHCDWSGVTCKDWRVKTLNLSNSQLTGPYPNDLRSLGKMNFLDLSVNSLTDTIPTDVCDRSTSNYLTLIGDAVNCPNEYNAAADVYLPGCCNTVIV